MAADANTAGQTSLWHAMSVDEAVKRLATHREKGLDATEAAARLKKYGANRLPAGKKRGPFMRFLAQFNNILVYVLLGAGFVKLMLSLWVDAAIIFAVVVLNGLLGFIQEGRAEKALEFDPQHAFRRSPDNARRRDPHAPGGGGRSGGRRAARVRRQGSGGPAAHRGEEPAYRRGGAHRQVRAGGEEHRSRFRQRHGRRPRVHGVFRHDGRVRPRDRRRRCDRQRDGARPDQPAAGRRKPARNSASAPDQEVRLRDNGSHRGDQRPDLLLWPRGRAHGFRRALPGGHRHRGVADPGRIACTHHDHTGHRRPAHGPAQRHHPPAACRRDAGLGVAHLLRQDGHADLDGNDGDLRRHRRVRLRGFGRRLRPGGRDQAGWEAGRRSAGPGADGARFHALQRCRALPGGRRLAGGGRSDRGRALSVCDQARHGPAGRAGGGSPHRRHPLRIGAQVHGDAPQDGGRQRNAARQGRAGSGPRALRSPANGRGPTRAARPRAFPAGVRQARGPRRAGAGPRLARKSGRERRQSRSGRSAEDPCSARNSSACSTRRARRRSRP